MMESMRGLAEYRYSTDVRTDLNMYHYSNQIGDRKSDW